MADPDAHAPIVVADMGGDRAQPVVAGAAAAGLDPHLAGREIDLVVQHHDVGQAELVKIHRLRDRPAGLVHVGSGQQQQHPLAAERPFRAHPLEAPPQRPDAVALGDRLDRHEADIVTVAGVAGAGIAEPDDEQHGHSPSSRGARTGRPRRMIGRGICRRPKRPAGGGPAGYGDRAAAISSLPPARRPRASRPEQRRAPRQVPRPEPRRLRLRLRRLPRLRRLLPPPP